MSDLKELIERLEMNIEKFCAAMDRAEGSARKAVAAFMNVIDHLGETLKAYQK